MKIETFPQEDHQVKLRVQVEHEEMENAMLRAARRLAQRVKIPGFRPGKAPPAVVTRHVGEAAVMQEAMELLVDELYPKAISEAQIKPYGPGSLENVEQPDLPVFEFIVPLEPEVEPGDYRALRLPYEPPAVSDEEVEKALENLREHQAVIEPVERAAQEGDLVTVRLSARKSAPAEAEDSSLIQETTVPILITAEEDPEEWPFPGFSQRLIGMLAGESRQIPYTFPSDAVAEKFRGLEAIFDLKAETVKSRTLPALNDEFARSLGDFADGGFESLEDLRKQVRQAIESEKRQNYDEEYEEKALDQATAMAVIKYPPQALEDEIDEVIESLERRLEQSNMTLEMYLKARNLDQEGLRQEVRPVAENRLRRSLYLVHLSRLEQIELDPNEVEERAINTLNYLARTLPKEEARRLSDRKVQQNLIGDIMVRMMREKTLERLRLICSGQYPPEAPATETSAEDTVPSEETAPAEVKTEAAEAASAAGEQAEQPPAETV